MNKEDRIIALEDTLQQVLDFVEQECYEIPGSQEVIEDGFRVLYYEEEDGEE